MEFRFFSSSVEEPDLFSSGGGSRLISPTKTKHSRHTDHPNIVGKFDLLLIPSDVTKILLEHNNEEDNGASLVVTVLFHFFDELGHVFVPPELSCCNPQPIEMMLEGFSDPLMNCVRAIILTAGLFYLISNKILQ